MDQEKLKRKLDDELMMAGVAKDLLIAGHSPAAAWSTAEEFISLAPWNRKEKR